MPTYKVTGQLIVQTVIPVTVTINSEVWAASRRKAADTALIYGCIIDRKEYTAAWKQPPQVEEVPRGR